MLRPMSHAVIRLFLQRNTHSAILRRRL